MGYLSPTYAVSGSISVVYASDETPSGAIDGINQTFTLATPPAPPTSLQLFWNNALLIYGVDYTLVGLTITAVTFTPVVLDTLRAYYYF